MEVEEPITEVSDGRRLPKLSSKYEKEQWTLFSKFRLYLSIYGIWFCGQEGIPILDVHVIVTDYRFKIANLVRSSFLLKRLFRHILSTKYICKRKFWTENSKLAPTRDSAGEYLPQFYIWNGTEEPTRTYVNVLTQTLSWYGILASEDVLFLGAWCEGEMVWGWHTLQRGSETGEWIVRCAERLRKFY